MTANTLSQIPSLRVVAQYIALILAHQIENSSRTDSSNMYKLLLSTMITRDKTMLGDLAI